MSHSCTTPACLDGELEDLDGEYSTLLADLGTLQTDVGNASYTGQCEMDRMSLATAISTAVSTAISQQGAGETAVGMQVGAIATAQSTFDMMKATALTAGNLALDQMESDKNGSASALASLQADWAQLQSTCGSMLLKKPDNRIA